MGLQITIRESGDVTVLDLRGKSTLSPGGSESLSRCLRKLEADGVRRLLLNLTDLVQIDSSGITLIVKAYIHLRARGGDLRLLRPNGHVLEVLRALRLLEVIHSYNNETEALAGFQRGYAANP